MTPNPDDLRRLLAEDGDLVRGVLNAAHAPLEVLIHKFCEEAYGEVMESVQQYLLDNVAYNLRSKLDAAERTAKFDREKLATAGKRIADLEAALRPFALDIKPDVPGDTLIETVAWTADEHRRARDLLKEHSHDA